MSIFAITDQLEFDAAMRYDEDTRENTTETPPAFLPDPSASSRGSAQGAHLQRAQPKATLRYKPEGQRHTLRRLESWFPQRRIQPDRRGRGCRCRRHLGVNDLFEAEVADTWEVGVKGQPESGMFSGGVSLFHTDSENGYFFVFLAANSTQNLGNLDSTLKGAEIELGPVRPTASNCTQPTVSRTARSRPWRTPASLATNPRWSRDTQLSPQYTQPLNGE